MSNSKRNQGHFALLYPGAIDQSINEMVERDSYREDLYNGDEDDACQCDLCEEVGDDYYDDYDDGFRTRKGYEDDSYYSEEDEMTYNPLSRDDNQEDNTVIIHRNKSYRIRSDSLRADLVVEYESISDGESALMLSQDGDVIHLTLDEMRALLTVLDEIVFDEDNGGM